MDVTFAHLCDYAMVSKEGKISVLGIFKGMNAPQLPYTHPQMYIAFEIELNYAELNRPFDLEIGIVDADGGKIFEAKAKVESRGTGKIGDKPVIGQTIGINNLRFVRPGAYNINFFLGGQLKRQLSFEVKLRQPPTVPGAGELDLPLDRA